ncbi:MAG: indolepyruvate oxidoreductase subunit beta [Nitrososphaerota archaeon]
MIKEYSIVIAGVGGQGGLTLSRIIAHASISSGLSVKIGETLGMSQRGGSVQSYVKIGRNVWSPLVKNGSANALIGMEPLETVRALRYIGPQTIIVLDPEPIPTIYNLVGIEKYPEVEKLLEILKNKTSRLHIVEARREAEKINARMSSNILLLGKLISIERVLPIEKIEEAIKIVLGAKAEKAIEAFRLGLKL